jgi:transposase-like protein
MARRCTICDHPDRDAIDEALINNAPYRDIARQHGISKDALTRHKQGHISDLLAKSLEVQQQKAALVTEVVQEKVAQETGQADSLLSQLKELMARTERIFVKAEESGDLRTALAAVKEGRGNLELLGRLIGELQDGVTVNLYDHPVWIDLRAIILTALEPYPEAKGALVDALSRSCR